MQNITKQYIIKLVKNSIIKIFSILIVNFLHFSRSSLFLLELLFGVSIYFCLIVFICFIGFICSSSESDKEEIDDVDGIDSTDFMDFMDITSSCILRLDVLMQHLTH